MYSDKEYRPGELYAYLTCSNPDCSGSIPVTTVKWKRSKTKIFYCGRECAQLPKIKALSKNNKPENYRRDIGMYVRSSWEANLARLLIYKNIPFEYEPAFVALYINKKTVYYLPDFVVNGKVIEVKGSGTTRLYKTDALTKQYKVKVYVVDDKVYGWLYKRYSRIIPDWEKSAEFERLLSLGLL